MKYTILTVAFILIAMTSLTSASTCPDGVYPCDPNTNFKNPVPEAFQSINNNSFNVNDSQYLQGNPASAFVKKSGDYITGYLSVGNYLQFLTNATFGGDSPIFPAIFNKQSSDGASLDRIEYWSTTLAFGPSTLGGDAGYVGGGSFSGGYACSAQAQSSFCLGMNGLVDSNATYSGVYAGRDNQVRDSWSSGIISGESNVISGGSNKSGIHGGNSNSITLGSTNSYILGGSSNTIRRSNNLILFGGGGSTTVTSVNNSLLLSGMSEGIRTIPESNETLAVKGNTSLYGYVWINDSLVVENNLTADTFKGNGSKLTDVCLANGTFCQSSSIGANDNVTAWNITVRNKLAVAEDIYTRNNITAKRIIAINGTHEIGLRIINLSTTDKIYPAIVSSGNLYFEVNSKKDTLSASPLYPGYVSTTGFNMNDGKGSIFGASLPGVTGVIFDTYNTQTNGTAAKYMRSLMIGVPDRHYSVPTYYASKSVLLGDASNYTCNRQILAQSSPSLLFLPTGCEKNVYGGIQHSNLSFNIWTDTGYLNLTGRTGVQINSNVSMGEMLTLTPYSGTLPVCNSITNHSITSNQSGMYACPQGVIWVKFA